MAFKQIYFSGESKCGQFMPNALKKDLCAVCQKKLQSHSFATEEQVREALEYLVDKEPSKVWWPDANDNQSGGSLFVGGYKASLNESFLREHQVDLVVNTAQDLHLVLGPKFVRQLENRQKHLKMIEDLQVSWSDDYEQKLDPTVIQMTVQKINLYLSKGSSVLVHCAQGKSRSAVLAVCFVASREQLSIRRSLQWVQQGRLMAKPNPSFMKQLLYLEKAGFFGGMSRLL